MIFVNQSSQLIYPPSKLFNAITLQIPYFDIMVPTIDTTRFGYLMDKLLCLGRPVLFTGGTGVGKVTI